MREKRYVPDDEFGLAGVLEMRNNHFADVISVYSQVNGVNVRALKSMRKNHRFVYNLDENTVTTYYRGFDEEKGVEPNEIFKYNSNEIEEMDELIENILDHQGYSQ